MVLVWFEQNGIGIEQFCIFNNICHSIFYIDLRHIASNIYTCISTESIYWYIKSASVFYLSTIYKSIYLITKYDMELIKNGFY